MSRITGGSLGGRVVRVPVSDGVRPTGDRVREALFSILGQDLEGVRVADTFSGTGMLGFEAWSRGADVVAVEKSPSAARLISEAAGALGVSERWRLVREDVLTWAKTAGPFPLILADPPWSLPIGPILDALAPIAEQLILEADVKTVLPDVAGPLRLYRRREYGRTCLADYRARDAAGGS